MKVGGSQPVPEAQVQQNEQPRGGRVPEPPVSFTYTLPVLRHSTQGLCSTPEPLRNSLPSSASCYGPGLCAPAPGGDTGHR